jgi:protoporphyrinogen oxidase
MTGEPDVLVVGGGIAGLAAALRLQDRGLRPLILEAETRVGGRMTTDRVAGFAIDTGVTLLGNRFRGMRALARRVGLRSAAVPFSLGIQDAGGLRHYRAGWPGDLLFDGALSLRARWAAVRMLAGIVRGGRSMLHGNSGAVGSLDRESVGEYFARLGRGGEEFLTRVLAPGLRGALGVDLAASSRFTLMQIVWNTLGAGFWNVDGGVDRIPEGVARHVPVELGVRVDQLRLASSGVEADVTSAGSPRAIRARAALLAVPGDRLAAIYPSAPVWIALPAARTTFSTVASAHVALTVAPACPHAGYAFAAGGEDGLGVLELEHLRAPERCPDGRGMVSVYFVDTPTFRCDAADDEELRERALRVVARTFPESSGSVEFVHLIRLGTGIARFPKGRPTELAHLRAGLRAWDAPIDLAGDWLDGVASESAVQTGQQAADRIAARLG